MSNAEERAIVAEAKRHAKVTKGGIDLTAIASFLTIMALALLISRIATVALTLTGLSREVSRFQARSALMGTGFTTREAEDIVSHPVRRRIVMHLMLLGNAGLVTAVSSFILSFIGSADTAETVRRVMLIAGGIGILWILSASRFVDRWLSITIRWALNRWTHLEARDYARLLELSGDYSIKEMRVASDDWLVGKTLGQSQLQEEGILLLGLRRKKGGYIGAPFSETEFREGDVLILYGTRDAIQNLDRRVGGPGGDEEHERAVVQQTKREQDEYYSDMRSNAD